jgi:hypothetical protein
MLKRSARSVKMVLFSNDSGGRRIGVDLRQFSYLMHVPERRSDTDRRNGIDRRDGKELRLNEDKERRAIYLRNI